MSMSEASRSLGLRPTPVRCSFDQLLAKAATPFIVHWRQNHFVVVHELGRDKVVISDPGFAETTCLAHQEFKRYWFEEDQRETGIALFLEPTPEFFSQTEGIGDKRWPILDLWLYVRSQAKLVRQVLYGLLAGAALAVIAPLLTKALVDYGIGQEDLDFVLVVLLAQIMVFAGLVLFDLIRGWLLLYISGRATLGLKADFIGKLIYMPLSFFDRRSDGDILERLADHQRVESFLSTGAFSFLFSAVLIFVYALILLLFDSTVFAIFASGAALYFVWVVSFLKRRRIIDYRRFNELAVSRSDEVHMLEALPDIKLNNAENVRRWKWEEIQLRLFKIGLEAHRVDQIQESGGRFILLLMLTCVLFVSARAVINGSMSLGEMLAIMLILGQVDSPLREFIAFARDFQDASLALTRMGTLRFEDSERPVSDAPAHLDEFNLSKEDINITNLSFRYGDPSSDLILDNVSMRFPAGKTTAIVGESGSGKTTLLKLLLKFYEPDEGEIRIGQFPLRSISAQSWRKSCSAVLQDGKLFSDTIANNIMIAGGAQGKDRMLNSAKAAAAHEFVSKLPLGYNTKVGPNGLDMSVGQQQRLLVARALYRQTELILFDEATSALDTKNERFVTRSIEKNMKGATRIVIAHRLSTVRDADTIYVMSNGSIVETGKHQELVDRRGAYFSLVRNQLEVSQ